MSAIDQARALVFTGGTIPTGGASLGDLANKANLANSGPAFNSRAAAVSAGQSALPASVGVVFTRELGVLVVRAPSQTEDQLFSTSPYWGVATRIDIASVMRDLGIITLTNVGGTAGAITADLPATASSGGLTAASPYLLAELIPTVANEAAPTLSVSGQAALPIKDEAGADLQAGLLVTGRSYLLRRRGSTWRVVAGGFGIPEMLMLNTRLLGIEGDVNDLKTATSELGGRLSTAESDVETLQQGSVRVVVQAGTGSIPDRPVGAMSVHWWCWEDPTAKMREMDVWIRMDEPDVPRTPTPAEIFGDLVISTDGTGNVVMTMNPVPPLVPALTGIDVRIDSVAWHTLTVTPLPSGGNRADLTFPGTLSLGRHNLSMRYANAVGAGPAALVTRNFWADEDKKISVDFSAPPGLDYVALNDWGLFSTTVLSWYPEDAGNGIPPGIAGNNANTISYAYYAALAADRRYKGQLARASVYVGSDGNSYVGVCLHSHLLVGHANGSWTLYRRSSGSFSGTVLATGVGEFPVDSVSDLELSFGPVDWDAGSRQTVTLEAKVAGAPVFSGSSWIDVHWDRSNPPGGAGVEGGMVYRHEPMIVHRTTSGAGGGRTTRRLLSLYAELD